MGNKIFPNAYIIGAQKSATTSLFDWLGQHPEVYANPVSKDFPFFTDEVLFNKRKDYFLKFFSQAEGEKIILGADANLMYVPDAVVRLHSLLPDIKLIVILRNPVKRAISAWRYAVERGLEKRTFEEAINEEMKGIKFPPSSWEGRHKNYLDHGLYFQQLKRVSQYYPDNKILILIYEDLVKNPNHLIKKVFRFLEIDESFTVDFRIKNKTSGGQRSKFLGKILYRARPQGNLIWGFFRLLIPSEIRGRIRLKLEEFNRVEKQSAPPVPDNLYKTLIDYYSEEISKLESSFNLNLQTWRNTL